MALKKDGTVLCWGNNGYGQCNVPVGLSGVVQVSAGDAHSVALKSNGTLVAWGSDAYNQIGIPAGLTGVVDIAAGGRHTVVRKSNGNVLSWGGYVYGDSTKTSNGQDWVPNALISAAAISAGYLESIAIPVLSLSVPNWKVAAGASVNATVFLATPPGSAGVTVTVASNNANVSVPSSVHLNAGVSTANFPVKVSSSAGKATVVLTATLQGQQSGAVLRIAPTTPPPSTIAPATAYGGRLVTCTANFGTFATSPIPLTIRTDSANATPVRSSIVLTAGSDTLSFQLLTKAVSTAATLHVSVYQGATLLATGQVTLLPPLTITFSPASVHGGSSTVGKITVPYPTQDLNGINVTLQSSSAAAKPPTVVNIPPDATSATFPLPTTGVSAPTTVTISGIIGSDPPVPGSFTIQPSTVSAVSVSPSVLNGNNVANLQVTLNGPAGVGGTKVALTSSSPLGGVPASVMVPAGMTTASVPFSPSTVSAKLVVNVQASTGATTASTSFTIQPTPNALASINFSPTSGTPGRPCVLTATFTGPSSASGLTILLKASSPLINLPPSLTSAPGATSLSYTFSPSAVDSPVTVTVQATGGSATLSSSFTIQPAALVAFMIAEPTGFTTSSYTLKGGTPVQTVAFAGGMTGPSGLVISLKSSNPALATVPSPTIKIAGGSNYVLATLTTAAVTSNQTVTVTATQGAIVQTITLTLSPTAPNPAALEGITAWPMVKGGQTAYGEAYAYGVSGGFAITLTSSNPAILTVSPSPLTIGNTLGPTAFDINTKPVTIATTVTITAKEGSITKTTTILVTP